LKFNLDMFNIDRMNLRRLDLNLLVVFDALMRERNVTRAAERVGLSQPAVSSALARLRAHFDDQLLVRGRDGMQPTRRALELEKGIGQALGTIDSTIWGQGFNPATARHAFFVETIDYVVAVYMPSFFKIAEAEAPGIAVHIVPCTRGTLKRLDSQQTQFAIVAFGSVPNRFGVEVCYRDTSYVIAMRSQHPLAAKSKISLNEYADASHLLVSPRGGEPRDFIDNLLAAKGLSRRVAISINQFVSAAPIVAATDVIVTLPSKVAKALVEPFGLVVRPLSLAPSEEFSKLALIWHRRFGDNPANEWFRATFRMAVEETSEQMQKPRVLLQEQ
jgi:DNA-binding transcriptional LysR family regulator